MIALLKDTSLAFTLGLMEMTGKAQTLGNITQHFIEAYLALAFIYLVISFTLEKLLLRAEWRLMRHEVPESAARERFRMQKKGAYRRIIAGMRPDKGGAEL